MKLYEQLSLILFVYMEQHFDFAVSDVASKWRNKTELYNVLKREENVSPTYEGLNTEVY